MDDSHRDSSLPLNAGKRRVVWMRFGEEVSYSTVDISDNGCEVTENILILILGRSFAAAAR